MNTKPSDDSGRTSWTVGSRMTEFDNESEISGGSTSVTVTFSPWTSTTVRLAFRKFRLLYTCI